jgi:thiol-disulfide isomerase/thioredoxin
MSHPTRSGRANALQVLLTIVAVAAIGLLLLLVVLAAAGSYFFAEHPGIDAAMAGLAPGNPAPAVAAEAWLNGEPPSLDGKVVVVQGWFYNCPYCWKEAPHLADLHRKYADRVEFVGLSTDGVEDAEKVQDFVATNHLQYPIGYGYDAAATLMNGFEARAFPAVWVIGRDGTVRWNRSLEADQSLEEAIKAALAGNEA